MLKKRHILAILLAILGLVTAISISIAPSFITTGRYKKTEIPFAGMTMAYQVYYSAESPQIFPRTVTFHRDPSEQDYFWVRDSGNQMTLMMTVCGKLIRLLGKLLVKNITQKPCFPQTYMSEMR